MSGAGRMVNESADFEEQAYAAGEDAIDGAERALGKRADDIEHMLQRLEDKIADVYDVIADRGARSIETVEDIIEESPWISIFAAFAAGALAAHLLNRR